MAREQRTLMESLLYHASIAAGGGDRETKGWRDSVLHRIEDHARGSMKLAAAPVVTPEQRRVNFRRFFGNA